MDGRDFVVVAGAAADAGERVILHVYAIYTTDQHALAGVVFGARVYM